jgi:hypothetical protein
MKIPSIISAYVKAKNDRDTDAVVACFANNAVVHDEGKEHHGLPAIKEWCANSFKKYQYTIDPTGIVERDRETILTATLAGNFPGSPVSLGFCFTIQAGKITGLRID